MAYQKQILAMLRKGGPQNAYVGSSVGGWVRPLRHMVQIAEEQGDIKAAIQFQTQILEVESSFLPKGAKRVFETQSEVIHALSKLSKLYAIRGHFPQAERHAREASRLATASYGPHHQESADKLYELARLLKRQAKWGECEAVLHKLDVGALDRLHS